jgi:hypothetical protein
MVWGGSTMVTSSRWGVIGAALVLALTVGAVAAQAGAWSRGQPLTEGRNNHTAVVLDDGRLLAIGGDQSGDTLREKAAI